LRGSAPRLFAPRQNSHINSTSLGCWLAPKTIPVAENCHLSCIFITSIPSKLGLPIFTCFRAWKTLLHRNLEIFDQHMHADTDSRLLLQKWSKSVQDKWQKSHIGCTTEKKTHLIPVGVTHWAIYPNFLSVHTMTRHKWHILGMLTSLRNNSHYPKWCHLSSSLITGTLVKITLILPVLGLKNTLHRNLEII